MPFLFRFTPALFLLLLLLPTKSLALEVGDAAPDFSLTGSDGMTYTLSQFKGVKPVVIAFFPQAFSGG